MPELEFTESELEAVTTVFKQYETGLREACIDVKDLLPALVSLGLNMMEQEVIDMTNTVARNGLVFFPSSAPWSSGSSGRRTRSSSRK